VFWCYAEICSPAGPLTQVPFVALLDIGINEYWFYPSWAHYPPDIDGVALNLEQGINVEVILPFFVWPDTGDSNLSGIFLYAAMLTQDGSALLGRLGSAEFSYGPAIGGCHTYDALH